MALPLDPTTPSNLSSPGLGDDEIRALKRFLVDVFGFPVSPSAIATPIGSTTTGGQFSFAVPPVGTVNEIGLRFFVSTGTYIKPSDLRFVWAIALGGGGGGGGPSGSVTGTRCGGGGGGGGIAMSFLSAAAIGATEAVTIGDGGVGGFNGAIGGNGGTTSFGSLLQAGGGGGGNFGVGDDGPTNGGIGGAGTVGQLVFAGADGSNGWANTNGAIGGHGGGSLFQGGGAGSIAGSANGRGGVSRGAAGGGGTSHTTLAFVAGNGVSGIVIVVEFKS